MPESSPRPRAPIWGESWTVGFNAPNNWTVLTFYDAVPFPRLDIRLSPDQVDELIRQLRRDPPPIAAPPPEPEPESADMNLATATDRSVNNSTALVDLNALSFIGTPFTTYSVNYELHIANANTGAGLQVNIAPTWGSFARASLWLRALDEEANFSNHEMVPGTPVNCGLSTPEFVRVSGTITIDDQPTLVAISFAQYSAESADTTVKAGSSLVYGPAR